MVPPALLVSASWPAAPPPPSLRLQGQKVAPALWSRAVVKTLPPKWVRELGPFQEEETPGE